MSVSDLPALKPELVTPLQIKRKDSPTYNRRSDNLEWIKSLPLKGLQNGETEVLIPMFETALKERLYIQYPGKESRTSGKRTWSNPRDFRPKFRRYGGESFGQDLTFSKLWDPLVDNLRSLEHEYDRNEFAAVLAILIYRMAYMVDYKQTVDRTYRVTIVRAGKEAEEQDISYGRFWNYSPPREVVRIIGKAFPDWGDMSFEAYLHYNSLLAWNEDGKCFAKFKDWNLVKATGRINTLLTHLRIIGFIIGQVELSALLGDFTRQRGMSPAHPVEIMKICGKYIATSRESSQQTL